MFSSSTILVCLFDFMNETMFLPLEIYGDTKDNFDEDDKYYLSESYTYIYEFLMMIKFCE